MALRIFGFFGPLHCGKSTAANYLIENYGYVRGSIGDGPKGMLKALGLSDEELYGKLKEAPCEKLHGQTPRHALQTLAQWGRENISPYIWCSFWSRTRDPSQTKIVLDDVRLPEDAETVRALGGILASISRPSLNLNEKSRQHITESYYDVLPRDFEILNDSSLEAFFQKIDALSP